MKNFYFSAILFFFCVSLPFISAIKNQNVIQKVALSTQIARFDITIDVYNDEKSAVNSYDILIPNLKLGELSILKVTESNKVKATINDLQDSGDKSGDRVLKVPVTIAPSSSLKLKVEAVYTHSVEQYPKKISQNDKQLSRFFGNHYFYSPYITESVSTTVSVPSKVIKHSTESPASKEGNSVKFGPYSNIKPKSHSELFVHFENDFPILTVNRLVREVEVSHWGNVAIEDFMLISNDGSELKSGFSRLDYQTNPRIGHVLKAIDFTLPEESSNVYYRDHIGNISTSSLWKNSLHIEPRFPLFGGWKTKFCMGYDIPLHQHVSVNVENTNLYTLSIPVGPKFGQDVVVDEQVIKVILPEGVTDIKVQSPFSFDSQKFETKRTYLDIEGRQVVVLEKKNLINEHENINLQVSYKFQSSLMWREPMMLIGGFFTLFLVIIIGSRLSFSLNSKVKSD